MVAPGCLTSSVRRCAGLQDSPGKQGASMNRNQEHKRDDRKDP